MKKLTSDDTETKSMLIIPDVQAAPEHPIDHLTALGNWMIANRPDRAVFMGDFNDNKAAGSYESDAQKGLHARNVKGDLDFANHARDTLFAPIVAYNKKAKRIRRYEPEIDETLGNHEYRLNRLCEKFPWLEALILDENNFNYKKYGITTHKFLEIISISGVWFSHYFPQSSDGNVKQTKRGMPNAKVQVQRLAHSAVAGHQQGLSTHIQTTPEKRLRGIIAGSYYQHDEDYMGPDGNNYWRGVLVLRNVRNGDFDLEEISIETLMRDWL